MHEMVVAQAARTPSAVALEWHGAQLSYAHLCLCATAVSARLRDRGVGVVQGLTEGYLAYKAHVSRQVYAELDNLPARQRDTEATWPEYAETTTLVSKPAYQTSAYRDTRLDASVAETTMWPRTESTM